MQTLTQSILIVEYDPPTLELYQRALSRDYKIFTCHEPQHALTLLHNHRFSAVVLELFPYQEQGWSLLATIKHSPDLSSIPVILCSTLDEHNRGIEMGATAYLVKPVLPADLLEMLHRLVQGNGLPEDLHSHPERKPATMTQASPSNTPPILEINNLKTYFFLEKSTVRALDGVDLVLPRRSTLGLVGESGCGKSIMAMSVMRLLQSPPGKIVEGEIYLHRKDGREIIDLVKLDPRGAEMREIRGSEIAIVFQEPMTSLNPLYTAGDQIAEAVQVHQKVGHKEALERALEMLTKVQIGAPKQRLREYPHQLSGGMRQRVMIALALSCNPSVLIADEPTTALDVTVQAQILDLMNQLQADLGGSIILITHNLGVVSQMADQVAVMYLGKIVEYGKTRELFHHPLHPYTVGLLNSVPVLGRKGKKVLVPIKGMVPTPTEAIRGCPFAPRCPRVMSICREQLPVLRDVQPGHQTACWLYGDA